MDDDIYEMRCPKCGSQDWRPVPWFYVPLLGLGLLGCGVWLIFLFIGIPMVIIGVLLLALTPFVRSGYQCQRCNHAWRAPKARRP